MMQNAQRARDRKTSVAYYYAGQAITAYLADWGPVSAALYPPDFTTGSIAYQHPLDSDEAQWDQYQSLSKAMRINRAGLIACSIFWREVSLTDEPPSSVHGGEHAALERLAHALHPESRADAYKAMIDVDREVRMAMQDKRIRLWLLAVAAELDATKSVSHSDLGRLLP